MLRIAAVRYLYKDPRVVVKMGARTRIQPTYLQPSRDLRIIALRAPMPYHIKRQG